MKELYESPFMSFMVNDSPAPRRRRRTLHSVPAPHYPGGGSSRASNCEMKLTRFPSI